MSSVPSIRRRARRDPSEPNAGQTAGYRFWAGLLLTHRLRA